MATTLQWNMDSMCGSVGGDDCIDSDYGTGGLANSAAWRAVNYVSDMVMKTPCYLKRKDDKLGYVDDLRHPAFRLIADDANPLLSALLWRQLVVFQSIWWGNHISWIQRNEDSIPLAIWPLDPNGVAIHVNYVTGEIRYLFSMKGQMFKAPPEDVFHIFGLSNDGLWGMDLLSLMRSTLRIGTVTRRHSVKFFSSGGTATGLLKFPPGTTKAKAREMLIEFTEAQSAMEGAQGIIALTEGVDYQQLTIPNEAAQFLETRELNDKHIANFIKVPPSVVGVESSVAYASYEQHREEVVDSGIDPWFVKIQDEARKKLLTEKQKRARRHVFCFDKAELKRVNHKDLIESTAREVDSGLRTLNEGRTLMRLPALPGKLANKPRKNKSVGYIDDEAEQAKREDKQLKAEQEQAERDRQEEDRLRSAEQDPTPGFEEAGTRSAIVPRLLLPIGYDY